PAHLRVGAPRNAPTRVASRCCQAAPRQRFVAPDGRRRLGRHVRDRPQPVTRRPARRRTHRVLHRTAGTSLYLASHYPCADPPSRLSLVGLVSMGHPARDQQFPSPPGLGLAQGLRRAPLACCLRPSHAHTDDDPRALRPPLAEGNGRAPRAPLERLHPRLYQALGGTLARSHPLSATGHPPLCNVLPPPRT